MKKLMLSIMILIGIYSFSINITGPRYRIDGTLGIGYKPDPHDRNTQWQNFKGNFLNVDMGIGFFPEWTLKINKKFSMSFGPKVTANLFTTTYETHVDDDINRKLYFSISTGARLDFNYGIRDNVKIYTGLETLTTLMTDIHISYIDYKSKTGRSVTLAIHPILLGKVSVGTKIKKYNVGLYTEFGIRKQLVGGVEVGYSF
ncbi:hypothetical protein KX935_06330 [Streptobacillus moniliformis]|uniref:Outer membrane protein beta-barrel domain-containing protein n=1 Tax=Streptobacillus moniliformis (strain ATCC 14647 / DSM 12112 / NCTC 10651 / 9901) TaxID=519441 RepID=D1AWG2_STRM9|nr:hypothetical protein [Streptobacillus moniliformis]ACZ00638.1 hypothetical protein Smon_0148 [Streptobacillus moniliformis DSM 12112]AVL42951.1 hypothetical protein CEP89_03495 [Streptobacillus moniliformis]QXW65405.1 hypothetical protein KX935_06330 [Streptobacillus moniliformis]SQA14234.1 Uncharacterised protein [Streptobacillus moniliformis]